MADSGLRKFISYLFNLVRFANGSASNAFSAQIFKTLYAICQPYSNNDLMKNAFLMIALLFISCNSNIEVIEKFADGSKKKVVEKYETDSVCEKSYHENGELAEIKCFKSGKQTGEQIYFREDGTKAAISNYRNGIRHGKTYEYYKSGQIAFEGIVKNGQFEGVSKWFFRNGKLNFIGNRHLGKDIGWWYYFNMEGDTIRRTYNKTINDTTQYFDGKGKKISFDQWEHTTREE